MKRTKGERRSAGERVKDAWRASELERSRRAGDAAHARDKERDATRAREDSSRERNDPRHERNDARHKRNDARRERDERRPGDTRPRVFDNEHGRTRGARPEAERSRLAHANAEHTRGTRRDETDPRAARPNEARQRGSHEDRSLSPRFLEARARRAREESARDTHSTDETRAEHSLNDSSRSAHPSESQLYGVSPVLEALRAGTRPVERVTLAEGAHEHRLRELLELARAAGVPVRRAPRAELSRMSAGANHQGVVATIAAARYADADQLLDALAARVGTEDPPLAVVLDGVEDPRNLGAIIRTAECAGAHGLFLPERRAAGLTEVAAKAAAGALEYVPVARAVNVARLVEELKERGVWTVGAAAEGTLDYTDWDWTQPCALLLGGEGEGLRRLVRERCDALVRIPLRGHISSLNVSVAAAVLLYEAVRQRTAGRGRAYEEQ